MVMFHPSKFGSTRIEANIHTYIHTYNANKPPSRIAHLRSTTTTTSGSKPVRRDPSSPLAPLLLQTRNWQKKKTLGTDPMAWRP